MFLNRTQSSVNRQTEDLMLSGRSFIKIRNRIRMVHLAKSLTLRRQPMAVSQLSLMVVALLTVVKGHLCITFCSRAAAILNDVMKYVKKSIF